MGTFPSEERKLAFRMISFVVFLLANLMGPGHAHGGNIDHPLFNANHCLLRVETSPLQENVDFYWGCGDMKYISMECVYDKMGYQDLGQQFAPSGWHCNRPLPVLKLDGENRIADVSVRSAGEDMAWAACFVESYGDSNSPEKPYHNTPCYRALEKIQRIVNQTQKDPREVAKELLY